MGIKHFISKKLLPLLLVSLLALTSFLIMEPDHAQAAQSETASDETTEYIIKLTSPVRARAVSYLHNNEDPSFSVIESNRQHLLVKLPVNPDPDLLEELAADPAVEYIEPNLRMRKASDWAIDPRFEEQWGLRAIQAPEAWKEGGRTVQVTVAVLDTGVDYTHPDLANRVDAQNGYNYIDGNFDVMDDDGHGTHVAGIIAAELNSIGIAGVSGNADVKILPLKVLDDQGNGTMYDVSFAIMDAVDKGADVINLSLSGERGQEEPKMLQEAIAYALEHDVVVVAAAGNDGDRVGRYVPASIPGVIAVSAVDEELELVKFSNYGSEIALTAPGEEILSTYLHGRYVYASGTSQAAPFVSGTIALMKASEPQLGMQEIEERLQRSAIDLGRKGPDEKYGYGLVNAYGALQEEKVSNAELRRISVDPVRLSLRPGSAALLQATAIYQDQTERDVTKKAIWQVEDESVATIEQGEVRGQAFGKTHITASFGGKRYTVPVDVSVRSLEFSSRRITLKPDEAVSLSIIATYGCRTREEVSPADVRWVSMDEEVAAVHNGIVSAQNVGSTWVVAYYGSERISIEVLVKMDALVANPDQLQLVPDSQIPVTLYAYYKEKKDVVTAEADWQTSNPEVAVIEDGVITAIGPGIATITAEYRGKSATIRVDNSVRKLDVPDDKITLHPGDTYTPELVATYRNGARVEVNDKGTWHSSDEHVAVVDEQGEITAIKEGTVSITASYGGRSARIRVYVQESGNP